MTSAPSETHSVPSRRHVTRSERRMWLLEGQNEVLELVAQGVPLSEILDRLALVIEWIIDPAICSIHLYDIAANQLTSAAGPSLSEQVNAPVAVRSGDGSLWGSVIDECKTIVVADIASDPLARDMADLAAADALRSCWAQPILSQEGRVLGVFTLYYRASQTPGADERGIVDAMAPLARVAIESDSRISALRSADERLTSLATSVPGVVYQRRVAPDGDIRYTYISDGARDLFGVSPEEIINDPKALFDCHGPGYRANFRERLLAASRDLAMWDVEAEIITRDGKRKFTHAIARPHRQPDGAVLWDGIILDTTRIKEAEITAAAAEARTRAAILESISQGLVLFDPEDHLVTCNSHFLALYPHMKNTVQPGASYESMATAEIRDSVEANDGASAERSLRERLKLHGQTQHTIERELVDGRWILINEQHTPDGGTVILHTDVTDLKRREQELRQAKDLAEGANESLAETNLKLDIALENMTQGLTLFDTDQRLVLTNRRYAELYDVTAELLEPGTAIDAHVRCTVSKVRGADTDMAALAEVRLRQASSRRRSTFRQRLQDGRVIEVIHQPLRDGGAVETFADVTDEAAAQQALRESEESMRERVVELLDTRRRLEQQGRELQALAESLARARDDAEAANRSKSEFLANMSHELRTPLNAVIGFSEALKGELFGPLGDPRYRDYAEDIHQSGNHLLELINDILDLSKVEAGELEIREELAEISEVVSSCRRLVMGRAGKAGVAVEADDATDLPVVRVDEIKLKQIMLNLMSNAVKFTEAGGTVKVTVARTGDGGIDLTVADSGIDIAPEHIETVLLPFRQVESALNRKYAGTGLGLPLVKALIEAHGGHLTLTSEVGVGTTAVVHLPHWRVVEEDEQVQSA